MTSKRPIAAANETGFLSRTIRILYFVRMDFTSGVVRLHSGIGPRNATHPVHGAEAYTGIGDFGEIEGDVVESINSAPTALRVSITGVKSAFNNTIITDDYHRRDFDLMVGLLDESDTLLADPEVLFSGFMDKADMVLTAQAGKILLTSESRATHLQRSSDWRFTDEDLQREYTGDLMGEYIYRMADLQLYWGDRQVGISGTWHYGGASNDRDRKRQRGRNG